LGGLNEDILEENPFPVFCEKGFSGYLCSECAIKDGYKYEKVSDNDCTKCIRNWVNILRMLGFGLVILIYIYILIIINLRKSGS